MHKNPIRDIPEYLRVFQTYLGARMYLVFALTLGGALAESVGILMLLPFLQGLDSESNGVQSGIGKIIQDLMVTLGWGNSTEGILVAITFAFLLKGALMFGSQGYDAYLRSQLLRELKGRLFDDYTRMDYLYYSVRDAGYFMNIINDQILQMLYTFYWFVQLGSQLIMAVVYIGLAFLVAWRFGMMALFIGVTLLLLFRWLNIHVRQLSRKTAAENGHLANLLIQFLHAFKYLTATGQGHHLRDNVIASVTRLTSYERRVGILDAFVKALREPIIVVSMMLIVLVQMVILKQPIAPIMVSILLFYRGLNGVFGIQSVWQAALKSIGSVEMVRDEFKAQRFHRELDAGHSISSFSQSVSLRNVSFSYDPAADDVLENVSMDIPARTSVALVGKSGAGKSTIVDLLTLMLKPRSGVVLIDGIPGEQIRLASWRRQIGYVSQEMVVFNDTIANNICMWEGDTLIDSLLMKRVRDAASQAYITNFIDTLPKGYQTMVGDRGVRLSGGQRQRLFIARELFRKPNLLILDEATSALDTDSERYIQKSIDALRGRITVVIIAHRLSTIRNVDYVFVFDKGRLVEHGPNQELRDSVDSRFGRLVAMQAL